MTRSFSLFNVVMAVALALAATTVGAQVQQQRKAVNTASASTTDTRAPLAAAREARAKDTVQEGWGVAEQEWRVKDAMASELLAQPGTACTAEVSDAFDAAEQAVRNLISLKRDYYKGLFDWYGNRYEAAGTVLSDVGPQVEALNRQREASENELSDMKRRDRALSGEKTAQAQADLRSIIAVKNEQIENLREAVDQLTQGRGKVQDERRIAANVRANIAEIMNKLRSEETLFDAFYRHQRATASLRCTAEGKTILPPGRLTLPKKGDGE